MPKCKVVSCHRHDIVGHGLCQKHYYRWLKYGDPNRMLRTESKEKPSLIKLHFREYRSYYSMKTRCLNKNYTQYKDYGGRGIKICDRWLGPDGFVNFLNDMGERPQDKTLDRIDVDGDYKPSNCRWATRQEQSNNMRTNIFIEYNGEKNTIPEWSRKKGFSPEVLYNRIMIYKWTPERALETPWIKKTRRVK